MTKEKAQIIIGNIPIDPEVLDDCYDITEYQEAKAMAIEALAQESITWIVGNDNCQIAVRNMPVDKMLKICAIIGEEEQQPCEDCISRQATIDALWKALYEYENKTEKQFIDSEEFDIADWFQHRVFVQNMSDIDRQTILNMPPVTPQPKTGYWIPVHPLQEDDEGAYMCSCCRVGNWGIDPKVDKYCFNCGADMRGGEE